MTSRPSETSPLVPKTPGHQGILVNTIMKNGGAISILLADMIAWA
jgi:hypothetical protein